MLLQVDVILTYLLLASAVMSVHLCAGARSSSAIRDPSCRAENACVVIVERRQLLHRTIACGKGGCHGRSQFRNSLKPHTL